MQARFTLPIGIFTVFNLSLLFLSSHDVSLNADATQYYQNALAMLDSAEYKHLSRQPMFSGFLSLIFGLFGRDNIPAAVISQNILVILTSFLAYKIAKMIYPKIKYYAFILTLFSPCLIFHSHILITETFYAFVFSLTFYCLLKYILLQKTGHLIIIGMATGVLALTRPEAKLFLIFLPILILILNFVFYKKLNIIAPILLFSLAYSFTMPWQFYVKQATGKFNTSSNIKQNAHLGWNVAILENHYRASNDPRAIYFELIEEAKTQTKYPSANKYLIAKLFSYPLKTYITTYAKALVITFTGSGAQYFRMLLNKKPDIPDNVQYTSNKITPKLNFSLTLVIFNFILRIIGLYGLYKLLVNNRKFTVISMLPVLFIAIIILFNGQSRFRLPIEPILMIWSASGIYFLTEKLKDKSWIMERKV